MCFEKHGASLAQHTTTKHHQNTGIVDILDGWPYHYVAPLYLNELLKSAEEGLETWKPNE